MAYNIPLTLVYIPQYTNMDFWQMFTLFPMVETTDTIFRNVLEEINECRNLVSLDNSIHSMFDKGALTLSPFTIGG